MKVRPLAVAMLAALLGTVPAVALLASGRDGGPQLASAGGWQSIVQQEAITPRNAQALIQAGSAHVVEPHFAAWNSDGSGVYVASPLGVFDVRMGGSAAQELTTLSPRENVLALGAGGLIAVLRDFETVVVREVATGAEEMVLPLEASVASARFSPDGRVLALVLDDGGLLQTWHIPSGSMLGEYHSADIGGGAYSVEFDGSGTRLVWFSPDAGQALDLASGAFGPLISFPASVVSLALSPDGTLVVSTSDDALSTWDVDSGLPMQSRAETPVHSLSFSPDGGLLVTVTNDAVSIFAMPSLVELHALSLQAYDALFSPDSHALAVIGAEGTISIWRAP